MASVPTLTPMFFNYFKVALRNFSRNKVFSFIHILGLSIGISASIVIFLIAKYEMTFDKFEKDSERIYRVVMDFNFNGTVGHSSAVPAPLGLAIPNEVTGVQATVPIMQFQGDATINVSVRRDEKDAAAIIFKKQPDVVFTSEGYFEMLPFEWIVGSPLTSMKDPFSAVLTESRARQYFGDIPFSQVVGKDITYGDDLQATVTGVVKDLNEVTDFTSKEFISYSTISKTNLQENFMMTVWNDWMAYSKLYVKLHPENDHKGVIAQLNGLLDKYNKNANEKGNSTSFNLQPLDDIHFNTAYSGFGQRTANKSTLYGLLAIAVFLLILGCINFINLNTAQASQRAKEIGIRKTIGSLRKQLVVQFLCETFCITMAATLLATSIAPLLLNLFEDFIPRGVTFAPQSDIYTTLFLIAIALTVTFLSGFYPALVLSGVKPVSALKNLSLGGAPTRSSGLRKILTVSQFVIAQFFIIAGFMVNKQIHYSLDQDLGYRKDAIVNFTLPRDTIADHGKTLLNKITSIPGVDIVSRGFLPPAIEGAAFTNVAYNDGKEPQKINVQIRWGDENFLKLYGIKMVAGRNIEVRNNITEVLINEAYVKALGFQNPDEAIGKVLTFNEKHNYPIVGVMRDFHEGSFHRPIGPIIFRSSDDGNFFHIGLSAPASNWSAVLKSMEREFHAIYPKDDFSYNFFDDAIAKFYIQERNTSRLLNWAMGLSILISCMGLLGLVMYTSETRRKEIGIRKILGASVSRIVSILSKEFILLVFLAFAISAPVAWWAVNQWLESFVYKTSVDWWVFALSGLLLMSVAVITLSFQVIKTARSNPVSSIRME